MTAEKTDLTADELETTLESIGEAMVILSTRGLVIRANQIALSLLNYREEDFIGKPFYKKVKALNAERRPIDHLNRPMIKAIVSGRPAYDYIYWQGKNLNPIPVFVSSAPIVKNGQLIGLIGLFRDISMEEAVDQMKSEFISLASHQLRTPLTSIKTYSHLILDGYMGATNEEVSSALKIIVTSTNRMNELISTLLSISRLESGAIEPRRGSVDIAKVASEVIDEMTVAASSSAINLKLEVKGQGSTRISSDGPIIKEIMANLVSNAIKYSSSNTDVIISLRPSLDALSIVVSNWGLGIPAGARNQIFTKFFRAPNVIRRETNGTGLGLYLIKGLVGQLGGKISFSSIVGKKTSFRVRLPRKVTAKE